MKYTISINQLANYEKGLGLDLIDLALFDFVQSFVNSGRCECISMDNKPYFWISPQYVISEMPILGIKTTRGINLRIENLINAGMLIRGPENQSKRKTYLAFGPRVSEYEFSTWNDDSKSLGTNLPSNNNINNNNKNNICAKTSDDDFSANGLLFENPADERVGDEGHCLEESTPTSHKHPSNNEANVARTKATLEERKRAFVEKCLAYVPKYGQGKVDRFINVWTEHNEGGRLMRFEMCKTFNLAMRLAQFRDYGHERDQEIRITPPRERNLTQEEIEQVMNWRRDD